MSEPTRYVGPHVNPGDRVSVQLVDGSMATGIVKTNYPVTLDIDPSPMERAAALIERTSSALESMLEVAPGSIAPAFRRVDALTGDIASLRCECDRLREQYDGMVASRDHARHANWQLVDAMKSLEETHYEMRDDLSEENDRLTAELDAAREENAQLQCRLDELEQP